jgi:hypothetical protein
MKWIIILTIVSFVIVFLLFLKGTKIIQEPEEGTVINYPEEEMFQENDTDEFSPDNIISDQTIKIVNLRYKLKKIEKEKQQNDVDLDYSREDGK